jgi:hypothetical protein
MTNYHVISAIMQRRRQTQREIKVHILIRAALYPLCNIFLSVFQVSDAAMIEDSSMFGRPNETSSEASSSGNCLFTVRL